MVLMQLFEFYRKYNQMKNIYKPEEDYGYRPPRDLAKGVYTKNLGIKPLYKGYNKAMKKSIYK